MVGGASHSDTEKHDTSIGLLPVFDQAVQGSSGAGTSVILGRGDTILQPPGGIVWFLRRILIAGWPNPQSVIAGTAVLYVTTAGDRLGPWEIKDIAPSVPNVSTWGRGECPVDESDLLIIDFEGLVNNQTVIANITVEWMPATLYESTLMRLEEQWSRKGLQPNAAPEQAREDSELSRSGTLGSKEHSRRQLEGAR